MKKTAVAVGLLFLCAFANAQDTRHVVEPKIPSSCTVLKARLVKAGGVDGIRMEDETKFDTARLQEAIDGCAAGKAVELAADAGRSAFLTGPLTLRTGVTLLVDKGVTLYGSRNPRDYDLEPGACGVVNANPKVGCRPLFEGQRAVHAGVMGEGVIEGRGGARILLDGKEGPQSWWDMGEQSKAGGNKHNPRMFVLNGCDDFTFYKITLRNSTGFHVAYSNGDGLTVWGIRIDTAKTARNTDGIDPFASKNITVTQSYIRTGDDNIALKADSDGPVTNMTVAHNHFYYGHGMSIGSGTLPEISAIRVTDLTLDGTQLAAIRIKSGISNGGLVHDVIYDDICIRDSERPIQFDTGYADNPGPARNHIPVFNDITLRNVRISGGGKILLIGYDPAHRIGVRFDGVMLDAPSSYKFSISHTDITLGPGPVNFKLSGVDSTASGTAGQGKLPSCAERFVPFPAD